MSTSSYCIDFILQTDRTRILLNKLLYYITLMIDLNDCYVRLRPNHIDFNFRYCFKSFLNFFITTAYNSSDSQYYQDNANNNERFQSLDFILEETFLNTFHYCFICWTTLSQTNLLSYNQRIISIFISLT